MNMKENYYTPVEENDAPQRAALVAQAQTAVAGYDPNKVEAFMCVFIVNCDDGTVDVNIDMGGIPDARVLMLEELCKSMHLMNERDAEYDRLHSAEKGEGDETH